MKKSRIRLVLLTLLILTLVLTGCGGGQEAAGPEEEADILQSEDYLALKATLDGIRTDSGAYYVYMMIPNADNDFLITVDGSEEPDDFLTNYGWEVQFTEAMEGEPATARSGWDDDVPVWSGFAPVYNSNGEVIGILGVDFPSPEIEDYPEWNRDREEWNGAEDELPSEIPQAVLNAMKRPMTIAAEAAETLNGEWADAYEAFMADKL
jgi:hypothetical protein